MSKSKEATPGESDYVFSVSDWWIFACDLEGLSELYWYNIRTEERRKYLGKDVEPEDCPPYEEAHGKQS